MRLTRLVKFFLTFSLFVIFASQSWTTVRKYLERKTLYQITTRDEENILFPSITFCKKFMYTQREFLSILRAKEVDVKRVKEYFRNVTFSRSELVTFLNMNTVEGSNSFPCNTVTGVSPGGPCQFPFSYPDCSLTVKSRLCPTSSTTYTGCRAPWPSSCYLREGFKNISSGN